MPYFVHHSHRLFYREQGEGPLVVMLPGNTASSACHADELEFFSRHYRATALDFWGTGQSERCAHWPDDWWEQAVYDVTALITHLGEKRACLIGTSGGAIVALLAAIRFPDRVQAVIADSCVEKYPADRLRQILDKRRERSERQVAFWQFAHGADWQEVVDADSERLLHLAQHGDLDWAQGHLRDIRCPVLFTASLQDTSLHNVEQQICFMARQIPQSRVFLVNAGEHPLMWSRQADFLHISEYFLKDSLTSEPQH